MADTLNDKLEAFLRAYYTADPVLSVANVADLVPTYLAENPDTIDDMTARYQKLIADAEAA